MALTLLRAVLPRLLPRQRPLQPVLQQHLRSCPCYSNPQPHHSFPRLSFASPSPPVLNSRTASLRQCRLLSHLCVNIPCHDHPVSVLHCLLPRALEFCCRFEFIISFLSLALQHARVLQLLHVIFTPHVGHEVDGGVLWPRCAPA
jgi:hypothetical protein